MYGIVYSEDKWWITYNGEILKDLGSFIDPISPKIIIEEIQDEI